MTLQRMRRDYSGLPLDESRVPADPLGLFRRWLAAAVRAGVTEPNAMTLATVDGRGRPRARMLLMKAADERGFTFFTNQTSAKGQELAAHPDAAMVFWWPQLHRSVRIEGSVRPVSAREAAAYFATRPRGAQLGAWTSRRAACSPLARHSTARTRVRSRASRRARCLGRRTGAAIACAPA